MPLTRFGKWTVVYGIVGLEVVAGGVFYYYWRRMNSSQGTNLNAPVQSDHNYCTHHESVVDSIMISTAIHRSMLMVCMCMCVCMYTDAVDANGCVYTLGRWLLCCYYLVHCISHDGSM